MKRFLALLTFLFFVLTSALAQQMNSLTDAQKKDGWQLLFDGKTLNGWHRYGNKPPAFWKVKDGAITLDTVVEKQTKGGGDLVTDAEYENFDFKIDWKISKGGNSGLIFLTHEDSVKYKSTYETGPEMQVLDNAGHPDAKVYKHKAGDLYDLIACSKITVKPYGQWNHAEIKVKDGKLDLYLNGTDVISTQLWGASWKKLIAGSKFATMPGFGTFKKGHVCLQDHGFEVSFRNVMVKQL